MCHRCLAPLAIVLIALMASGATAPTTVATALTTAAPPGGAQVIPPNDPSGGDVRAAADAFWSAITSGDAAKARSLFAGTPPHAELIETYIEFFEVHEGFLNTMRARLGDLPGTEQWDVGRLRAELARATHQSFVLAGDAAWIPGVAYWQGGTRLERIGGAWKVTRLAPHASDAKLLSDQLRAQSAMYARLRDDIASKRIATTQDLRKWSPEPKLLKAMNDAGAAVLLKPDVETPEVAAAAPPGNVPLRTADLLAGLLGTSFADAAVQRELLPQLAGLPIIQQSRTAVLVTSNECGVDFDFAPPPKYPMDSITLHNEGSRGSHAYRGTLPRGLRWDDTRADVEAKLGPAPASAGGGRTGYVAFYGRLGPQIDYDGDGTRDPAARMLSVTIKPADVNAPAAPVATQTSPRPRLEFRLVAENAPPRDPKYDWIIDRGDRNQTPLPIERDVLLDESAVANVVAMTDPQTGKMVALIEMTEDGSKRLEQITRANVHRRLAILIDSELVIAPNINEPVSKRVQITTGGAITDEQFRDWIGRMHAAVTALPTTRPIGER
jgi:hypothetical protein